MIKAEKMLDCFMDRLKADSYFDSIKIIRAYPHSVKPTLLKNAVVAAGIRNIELEGESVMQNVRTGKYSIFTDIFVPCSFERRALEDIVFRISADVAKLNVASIEISAASSFHTEECFSMRAVFTFHDEIGFEEETQ